MKVKLLLLSTAVKPNEFNVTLPAKIGRGKEASLRLVHSQISRLHCELFEQDGQLLVATWLRSMAHLSTSSELRTPVRSCRGASLR